MPGSPAPAPLRLTLHRCAGATLYGSRNVTCGARPGTDSGDRIHRGTHSLAPHPASRFAARRSRRSGVLRPVRLVSESDPLPSTVVPAPERGVGRGADVARPLAARG